MKQSIAFGNGGFTLLYWFYTRTFHTYGDDPVFSEALKVHGDIGTKLR